MRKTRSVVLWVPMLLLGCSRGGGAAGSGSCCFGIGTNGAASVSIRASSGS